MSKLWNFSTIFCQRRQIPSEGGGAGGGCEVCKLRCLCFTWPREGVQTSREPRLARPGRAPPSRAAHARIHSRPRACTSRRLPPPPPPPPPSPAAVAWRDAKATQRGRRESDEFCIAKRIEAAQLGTRRTSQTRQVHHNTVTIGYTPPTPSRAAFATAAPSALSTLPSFAFGPAK